MFRRAILGTTAYDPRFPHAEDYDLMSRLSLTTRIGNMREILIKYRVHHDQV